MSGLADADLSLLGADFGAAHTRVSLLDVVDGQYRVIGVGSAPTTSGAPYRDVTEGMRHALDQLSLTTGRVLLDSEEKLILPGRRDGAGVDAFVATASAGINVRAVIVGLMPDISVESLRHLAASTYISVVDEWGLHDRRTEGQLLDALIGAQPDLVLVAGGTEAGASEALLRILDTLHMALRLIPEAERPKVLYAGNSQMSEAVLEKLDGLTRVHLVPNLRPALDLEDLGPAQAELARIFDEVRAKQLTGFEEPSQWAGGRLAPTARAFGQVIRFLSRVYEPRKGVLGVDVGASSASVAAAFEGRLHLSVQPALGLGHSLMNLLEYTNPSEITRWLPTNVPEDRVLEFMIHKSTYPETLPGDLEELYLEHALAREIVRAGLQRAARGWPSASGPGGGLLPWFEPVVASGAVFAEAPRPGQAALMLLDALQPTGVTTLVLDRYGLAPILGATAGVHPTAVVQILDSGVFANLGTVVSPVGSARAGSLVLEVSMELDSGQVRSVEVPAGRLEVLPLPPGQTARLTLRPLGKFDVGLGPGRAARVRRVQGSALGVVIDARGRPLKLAGDPERRIAQNLEWLQIVDGI